MTLTLRDAREEDCAYLAARLRAADLVEVQAGGSTPLGALSEGFHGSLQCVVAVAEHGRPIMMAGLGAMPDPLIGSVWALGSDEIRTRKVAFIKLSHSVIRGFNERFPVLMNAVDERNTVHIAWLRWMGFTFIRRHPALGPERRPFIEFVRLRDEP